MKSFSIEKRKALLSFSKINLGEGKTVCASFVFQVEQIHNLSPKSQVGLESEEKNQTTKFVNYPLFKHHYHFFYHLVEVSVTLKAEKDPHKHVLHHYPPLGKSPF
jgi:hypothetical protein